MIPHVAPISAVRVICENCDGTDWTAVAIGAAGALIAGIALYYSATAARLAKDTLDHARAEHALSQAQLELDRRQLQQAEADRARRAIFELTRSTQGPGRRTARRHPRVRRRRRVHGSPPASRLGRPHPPVAPNHRSSRCADGADGSQRPTCAPRDTEPVGELRGAYSADRAAALSGVPRSTVHYWARKEILVPSVSAERIKLWSYSDLMALRTIAWLRATKKDPHGRDVPATTMKSVRKALADLDELDLELWDRGNPTVAVDRAGPRHPGGRAIREHRRPSHHGCRHAGHPPTVSD